MADFINKVLAVLLAMVLLIIAPLNLHNLSIRTEKKMKALNEMQLWIDKVCDKGSITIKDLDELNLNIAATGLMTEITVEDFRMLASSNSTVLAKMCNVSYDRIIEEGGKHEIEPTNVIRVHVKEKVQSSEARLWSKIIGVDDVYDEYLSSMRR